MKQDDVHLLRSICAILPITAQSTCELVMQRDKAVSPPLFLIHHMQSTWFLQRLDMRHISGALPAKCKQVLVRRACLSGNDHHEDIL